MAGATLHNVASAFGLSSIIGVGGLALAAQTEAFWRFWVPSSRDKLARVESQMLEGKYVGVSLEHIDVELHDLPGKQFIHTVVTRRDSPEVEANKPPLLLLHGFGGGLGLWSKNFEVLSQKYRVYAIDVPGFGRTRVQPFCGHPSVDEAESFFVNALESWRKTLGLDTLEVLGHSMGGYVATVYALNHPTRVRRLLLLCPFGYPSMDIVEGKEHVRGRLSRLPWYWRGVLTVAQKIGPLTLIRALGPLGPKVVGFRKHYDNSRYAYPDERASEYVYHLTAASAIGDKAFAALHNGFLFPHKPLPKRVAALTVPTTFIVGDTDPICPLSVDPSTLFRSAECQLVQLPGAAHHPYATHPDLFHNAVLNVDSDPGPVRQRRHA